jgi:hypothetical protein
MEELGRGSKYNVDSLVEQQQFGQCFSLSGREEALTNKSEHTPSRVWM